MLGSRKGRIKPLQVAFRATYLRNYKVVCQVPRSSYTESKEIMLYNLKRGNNVPLSALQGQIIERIST